MVKKIIVGAKEKLLGLFGSLSGVTSLFGSWQICHNICLGLVALLSVIGISVAGLPLYFLNQYAVPLWGVAFGFLLINIGVYFLKKCISGKLILFNSGLILAGTPFKLVQDYAVLLWVIGGLLAGIAIMLFIKERLERRKLRGVEKMSGKMNKISKKINKEALYIFVGVVIVLTAGALLVFYWNNVGQSQNYNNGNSNLINPASGGFAAKSTGSTNPNDVEIVLTPKSVSNGILSVDINANTHSVELGDFDFMEITTLEYDGKKINPSSAQKLSSHHGSGSLLFNVDGNVN